MIRIVSLVLGGIFAAQGAFAEGLPVGDPAEGRKLARQCSTCHGRDGIAQIPIAPHIGGEPARYLADQLVAFRDGTREHEMMTVVTKDLSDQAIADVAAWYASFTPTATLTADASGAPKQCTTCHGVDGISRMQKAPNLAGESTIYTATQLKAFRSGARQNAMMNNIAKRLSDEDIRASAEWYASIKLEMSAPE